MKKIITISLCLCALLVGTACPAAAQPITTTAKDSARTWVQHHHLPVELGTYQSFKESIQPLLDSLSAAQVVGLGEGTHGTSEFQTVRSYITRYLCEEKGFSVVCLENSYGWCAQLNQYIQTGVGSLDTLMRQNLLGMWQNTEIKELLQWMRQYNQTHTGKIHLGGIDYSETSTSARLVLSAVKKLNNPVLNKMADSLLAGAVFMDTAYASMNTSRPYRWKEIVDQAIKAYTVTRRLQSMLDSMAPVLKDQLSDTDSKILNTALYNCQLAWYNFWAPGNGQQSSSRDEAMAGMVRRLSRDLQGAKAIVWAHNGHLAKAQVLEGAGPATGMYLDQYYPGNYFVVGTGTAKGTCSFTSDRFIVSTSRFKSRPLHKAIKGSWEQLMMDVNGKAAWIDARDKRDSLPALPLRVTGYRASGKKDFMPARIHQLFDAFLFIPVTRATHTGL